MPPPPLGLNIFFYITLLYRFDKSKTIAACVRSFASSPRNVTWTFIKINFQDFTGFSVQEISLQNCLHRTFCFTIQDSFL